jgi:hypothetical protein
LICSTFSLKPFPSSKEEFKMGNHAVAAMYRFPIASSFKDAVKKVRETASQIVGGPFLVAFHFLVTLVGAMPYCMKFYYMWETSQPI